jgi:hypothetical protein
VRSIRPSYQSFSSAFQHGVAAVAGAGATSEGVTASAALPRSTATAVLGQLVTA